jgi:hypothetical protein
VTAAAHRIDPPRAPSSAARSKRYRLRRRAGLVRLAAWVDEAAVDLLLARHGLLPMCGTDDRAALDVAWQQLVDRLLAADAEQRDA